jgi:molecular chaperone HscB
MTGVIASMNERRARAAACWSCGAETADPRPFCAACGAVQPPADADHFSRLGLEPRFDLDETALERAYVAAQRDLHPDRFVGRPVRERRLSAEQSMALNESFAVLRDPLARAEYLLELAGHPMPSESATTSDPALLGEALELRESLAEADGAPAVARLAAEAAALVEAARAEVGRGLAARDWSGAATAVRRLRYLARFAAEVEERRLGTALPA